MRELEVAEVSESLTHSPRPVVIEAMPHREFFRGHLPGAVCVPRTRVATLAPEFIPDKGAEVIVYCKGKT